MDPQPELFDWVTRRSECNLTLQFHLLSETVKTDVETMERIGRAGFRFGVRILDSKLIVFRAQDMAGFEETETVVFSKERDLISVKRMSQTGAAADLFTASPVLQREGACKLEISGQPLELWQVSRRALENLFFG